MADIEWLVDDRGSGRTTELLELVLEVNANSGTAYYIAPDMNQRDYAIQLLAQRLQNGPRAASMVHGIQNVRNLRQRYIELLVIDNADLMDGLSMASIIAELKPVRCVVAVRGSVYKRRRFDARTFEPR